MCLSWVTHLSSARFIYLLFPNRTLSIEVCVIPDCNSFPLSTITTSPSVELVWHINYCSQTNEGPASTPLLSLRDPSTLPPYGSMYAYPPLQNRGEQKPCWNKGLFINSKIGRIRKALYLGKYILWGKTFHMEVVAN